MSMDDVLAGLAIEKQRIALTDEMARRVGLPLYRAHLYLAIEKTAAKKYGRKVDMTRVAWAIKFESEGK
jgi:hypothetical protein